MLLIAKASETICDSQAEPVRLVIVDRAGNRGIWYRVSPWG